VCVDVAAHRHGLEASEVLSALRDVIEPR
jgi:hypothetical protein